MGLNEVSGTCARCHLLKVRRGEKEGGVAGGRVGGGKEQHDDEKGGAEGERAGRVLKSPLSTILCVVMPSFLTLRLYPSHFVLGPLRADVSLREVSCFFSSFRSPFLLCPMASCRASHLNLPFLPFLPSSHPFCAFLPLPPPSGASVSAFHVGRGSGAVATRRKNHRH